MTVKKDSPNVERLKDQLFRLIEETMEKEEVSQAEVARRLGAQRYNINKVMRGKFVVTLDFLVRMAETLGLDVEMKIRKQKQ